MRHRLTYATALALGMILPLAACADDDTSSNVISAPSVIRISADGAAKGRPQGLAADVGSESMAEDLRRRPWWGVAQYELDAALPALDSSSAGWHYVAQTELNRDAADRVIAAFGLEGDLEAIPDDWGGGWRVGPADGSAPALWFGTDALGWWSYSAPWPAMPESEGSSEGGSQGSTSVTAVEPSGDARADDQGVEAPMVAEEMKPPVGVPSLQETRRLTLQLAERLGLDMSSFDIEVYADTWGASATLWHRLDGHRTGFATSVGFGENASVSWAGGHLNTPVRVEGFERVGTTVGFERLSNSGGWWGGVGVAAPEIAAMPYPQDGDEEPPVITISIVDVEESWWMLYDADGDLWLLPGYTFTSSDGGEHLVPAVLDELIEPIEVRSAPVDPDSGTVSTDTAPGDELALRLIGLEETAAADQAKEQGFELRVIERDGESFPVTADYRIDRINAVIADGLVVKAAVG